MGAVRIDIKPTDKILKVDEVAKLLKVSRSWVEKNAVEGNIPSRKLGHHRRFIEREVLDWFNRLMR